MRLSLFWASTAAVLLVAGTNYCAIGALLHQPMDCLAVPREAAEDSFSGDHGGAGCPADWTGTAPLGTTASCCAFATAVPTSYGTDSAAPTVQSVTPPITVESAPTTPVWHGLRALDLGPPASLQLGALHLSRAPPLA